MPRAERVAYVQKFSVSSFQCSDSNRRVESTPLAELQAAAASL